jgi:hypothetical protein
MPLVNGGRAVHQAPSRYHEARQAGSEARADDFIGRLKGVFEVVGDLDSDSPDAWESAF